MKNRLTALLAGITRQKSRRSTIGQTPVAADLEKLENRALLTTITAKLTIFANGDPVDIPSGIGVSGTSRLSQIRTDDANGSIVIEPIGTEARAPQTLGDFFELWRTNAGDPGNNPDAIFNSEQLLGNSTNFANDVRVFVNGQVNTDFETYEIQDEDQIILVFGSDPVVSINTNFGPIVIELFESQTPITVDNFLNYVNDGDYIDSFIHRSDPDFVIQGGGFATTSTTFVDTSQFTAIQTDGEIQNEPGISNVRGTVAMAKRGGNPNSATSQWFVNLNDSNTFLDSEASGAFTVFGQVLDMTTVDEIEDLTVNTSNGSPFGELPLSATNELPVVSSIEGLGTISGVRFEDINGDGSFDAGDIGLVGATVYLDANDNGVLDSNEESTQTDSQGRYRFDVVSGTYAVRADVQTGNSFTSQNAGTVSAKVETGRVAAEVDNNFGESSVAAPTGIALRAITDTGLSQSDRITNRNNADSDSTLQFEVTGVENGSTVEVFANGVSLGTAAVSGNAVTLTTNATELLADATYSVTARQTVNGKSSGDSVALLVTIDTELPPEFTALPPATTQVEQPLSFDVENPEESSGGEYSLVNAPTGMAIDQSTGTITWTPTSSQTGPQTFEIQFEDRAGNIRSAVVDMTVLTAVPAVPDAYNLTTGSTLAVNAANGVLANDGPASNNGQLTASVIEEPQNGSLTFNADGSFEYTRIGNFEGTDTFTYRATDGAEVTNIATVTIEISGQNQAPVGNDDTYTISEDTSLTVTDANGVLANDNDPDGDTVTASLVSNAVNGQVSQFSADGSFVYTPDAEFSGTDTFTYQLTDGQLTTGPVTVTVTIQSQNDIPTANSDSYSLDEDGVLTTTAADGLLVNDTDPEGDGLTATLVSPPTNGTLNLSQDGTFTYTPNANFFGPDQFSYFATDGTNESNTVVVNLTVNSVPDAPTATDDTLTAQANQSNQELDVLANDESAPDDTETLTITSVSTGSEGGVLSINANSDGILYTPPVDFVGDETFTYTIEDEDNLTASATVTVTTSAGNVQAGVISGVVFVDLNNNGSQDSDESGIPGVQMTLSGGDADVTFITDNEGEWEFTDLAAGTYTVTQTQPTAHPDGSIDLGTSGGTSAENEVSNIVLNGLNSATGIDFGEGGMSSEHGTLLWRLASSYRDGSNALREMAANIEENAGNTDLADAIRESTANVVGNAPPRTVNESYQVVAGQTLSVDASEGLLANDRDADGDSLTATVTQQPANGTLTLAADGSFEYSPNNGFSGTDEFDYSVSDGFEQSEASTTIVVATDGGTFSVNDSAISGTSVGTVSSTLAGPVFEVINSETPTELNLAVDDHISGDEAASVVLVEYLDFQCPACRAVHPIIQEMKQEFDGDLLVVTRHLPLTSIHPNAIPAARAAEAAANQGQFDDMADLLFENQADWSGEADPQSFFEDYADQLGLDIAQFRTDMNDSALLDGINQDAADAGDLNATGTPTIFLNGSRISTPGNQQEFSNVIQAELDSLTSPFSLDRLTGEIAVRDASLLSQTDSEELLIRATDAAGATEHQLITIDVNSGTAAGPVIDSIFADTDQLPL